MAVDKAKLFGSGLRVMVVAGSLFRIATWLAQKPTWRNLDLHMHYEQKKDEAFPESCFTLTITDTQAKFEKTYDADSLEQVLSQAVLAVSKSP